MKLLFFSSLLFILTSSSAFALESFTVVGPKLGPKELLKPSSGNPPIDGSSGSWSPSGGGTGGALKSSNSGLGGWKVGETVHDSKDISTIVGKILEIASKTISAEGKIHVKLETPEGYKIEIDIEIKVSK